MARRALKASLVGAICLSLFLASLPAPTGAGGEDASWAERFPDIAARIPHLDQRLANPDPDIRKRVIVELTYFRPRDSRRYPPFFRALLYDPAPEIRWEAVHRLWEHHHFLSRSELPKTFRVPLLGPFQWEDHQEVKRFRASARSADAAGGWAIHALALVGDRDSIPLAQRLLASPNVFTRFQAAVALVQLGEEAEGREALQRVAAAPDDPTGFYRYRAAECLYRLGDTSAVKTLISLLKSGVRSGYADGPLEVLQDLTGQNFTTAQEWRTWWRSQQPKQ